MSGFIADDFLMRLDSLQKFLISKSIDLAVLNQNSDLYYYTGSVQPMYLLVPASGKPLVLARKAMNRIQDEVTCINAEFFIGTKDLLNIFGKYHIKEVKRLGFTADTTAYATVTRFQQLFGGAETVDLSWDLKLLRIVKSEKEIMIHARAGEIMAKVPALIKDNFRPGISELEMSAIIENYFRVNGHGALVRCRREGIEMGFGVCSAGVNSLAGTKFDGVCAGKGTSAAVPYGASWDPIRRGEPVVVDYAFNLDGYHLDQTRMFCWGEPAEAVVKAYYAMVEIEQTIAGELKPGKIWTESYERAVTMASEMGYEKEFMGVGTEKVKFVGHGLGLELDEPPFLAPKMDYPLQEGMVLALEPKVALPEGVVGIEDSYVIWKDGAKRLTDCAPELIIIE